jgi:MFS family permease
VSAGSVLPRATLLIGARVVQGVGAGLLLPTTFIVLIRAARPARLGLRLTARADSSAHTLRLR